MKPGPSGSVALRPLRKAEIDGRIDALVQELAADRGAAGGEDTGDARPRWISAGELVRRMRPFLVLN